MSCDYGEKGVFETIVEVKGINKKYHNLIFLFLKYNKIYIGKININCNLNAKDTPSNKNN